MWGDFALSTVVCLAVLYLPFYAPMRVIGLNRIASLLCGPLAAILFYSIAGIVFSFVGIPCSAVSVLVPAFILALAAVFFLARNGREERHSHRLSNLFDTETFSWKGLFLYVFLGLAVGGYVFLWTLDGPSSFISDWDNAFHLSNIQSFLQTQEWSTIGVNLYATESYGEQGGISYYPSAWHIVCCLIISIFPIQISIAVNVVNFVFIAFVYPSSMYLLMTRLFPENKAVIIAGSACCLAFIAFPWRPLLAVAYPNFAAFCILPAVMGSFLELMRSITHLLPRNYIVRLSVAFGIGLFGAVLIHPNTVFTLMVFALPFCLEEIFGCKQLGSPIKRLCFCAGFVALFVSVWLLFLAAPFMQALLGNSWSAYMSPQQALVNLATLSLRDSPASFLLGFVVLVGFVKCLFCSKNQWLSISYILFALLFVISVSVDGPVKQALTGFWYTDRTRLAMNVALCGVPLAAQGLSSVIAYLKSLLFSNTEKNKHVFSKKAFLPSMLVAFLVCVYYPNYELVNYGEVTTPFGQFRERCELWQDFKNENILYSKKEKEFMEQVKEIVPDGVTVINQALDGSQFSYGTIGANVYFRATNNKPPGNYEVIKEHLSEIRSNKEVQKAVEDINAGYVVLLDSNNARSPYVNAAYNPNEWVGIESIDKNTPGFELVLSKDDMRLYKIL